MQLNHECVRDLLLYIEDHANYHTKLSVDSIRLEKYSFEEIVYTVEKLSEADFINVTYIARAGGQLPGFIIQSITYDGHEFLDNIRDNSVWKDTKKQLSNFSSTSLQILSSVAVQILSAKIKFQLGI